MGGRGGRNRWFFNFSFSTQAADGSNRRISMRDARLWICVSLLAMIAGFAEVPNQATCTGDDVQPANGRSIQGAGVERGAILDTGTVVRPAR